MGIVTELFKLGMKTAVKQADEVVPRVVSQIDETSDILKTLGRKESDISDFHSKYFRGDHKERYRSKDLQEEAIKLNEGLIGLDDFIKSRDTIKPLKTYGTVPPLNKQTDEAGKLIAPDVFDPIEIVGPLGKDKVDKSGIIGVNKNIKEGERVTSRFDIDAYNMYDRYIAAIQTKVKGKFKLKGYSPTAVLKDVKFNYRPNQAFAIAQGKGKSPFATMEGNWKNLTPEETHKYANKKIETKEWTEVGFDPAGRLSFYNRATGEPVFNAEEVIQVGAMLLARGIKKPTKKQLEKLSIETKAGEVMRYKEGGSLLPVIKREAGGGGSQNEAEAAAAYDDYTSAYESPSGFMDDTDAGLYADKYGQPGKHQSPEDRMNNLTGTDTRYNPLQSPEMKVLTGNPFYFNPEAPKNEEEQRQQDEQTQLFENYKSLKEADPLGHLTSFERKNEAILEMIERRNRLEEEYGITINSKGQLVRMDSDEVAPMAKGGQVLEGLDREYMRQRNSKEKVEGMMGILPIQPRQYGGGLDDAYMNRRSAFAAPDANSAFASPMGRGDLPTMYRQEGGDIPITSVNGQGIRRVIYRESGGGLTTIYREDGGTTIPKERMINDQPHQLSYINDREAGLLKALGGSGRMVDGIPAYEDDLDEGSINDSISGPAYSDDGLGGDYGGDGGLPGGSPAPAAPSDGDDESNYVTDERYAELYGRSGDGKASFTDGTFDPNSGTFTGGEFIYGRPGDPQGPSQQDYIQRLNKEGFPEWSVPYYNSLKNRGMTNDQATAALAAAMSTPGGLSGMQNAYAGDYSYGGAFGTMQDLLEKGLDAEFDIDNELADDKDIKAYNKDDDEEFLSEAELNGKGLLDFATSIQDKLSIQSDLTPTTMALIEAKANDAGLNFQPVSPFMAGLMDFGISAIGGLAFPGAGSLAKGLSNMTGAGRTIGTVTKDGLQYNLSDTGKFSLNTEPTAPDYGNDEEPKKRSKPIEEKITETVTEDKPLTGMAGLLAKRDEPISRKASNKYSRDLLDSLGYGNVNIG